MKIVVCIRQSADGEINPFDASAYETALRIAGAEIVILSMGPEKTAAFLKNLTRLGAKEAVLLTDKAFAGADTLATSYTLSLAINRLKPDLIICGRQSVDGDTGQVGPSLSVNTGYRLLTNVMSVVSFEEKFIGVNRTGETVSADLNADLSRCGLAGSPTRVIKTFENEQDRRRCNFIAPSELKIAIEDGLKKSAKKITPHVSDKKLENVWIVGESPREAAETIAENITVVQMDSPQKMAELIRNGSPNAVLWGSDTLSKAIAPQVAALLKTGLCADCTALETDGETLYMYRPACSGNIIAKIRCETVPPMATVRTAEDSEKNIIIGIGYGAKESIPEIKAFAKKLGAGIAATRKMVDNDYLPYELQVGLTGKSVNPNVYISFGVSGAVHHIAGIRQSGTVIAVNPDKDAPIFNFSDYGIVASVDEVIPLLEKM